MKTNFFTLLTLFASLPCACQACNTAERDQQAAANQQPTNDKTPTDMTQKILVAYFSRTGENYAVGTILKGIPASWQS